MYQPRAAAAKVNVAGVAGAAALRGAVHGTTLSHARERNSPQAGTRAGNKEEAGGVLHWAVCELAREQAPALAGRRAAQPLCVRT